MAGGAVGTGSERHGVELFDELPDLQPTDVAFAFTGPPPDIELVLNHAHDIGATTIVIGDHIGAVLRPMPKILLAASREGRGESQSLTVPMAICNTLILEISQNDNRKTLKSLDTLASLKQTFANS